MTATAPARQNNKELRHGNRGIVRQVKAMQAMGATAVVLTNVSGADPIGTIRLYGEHVLPRPRG